MESYLEINKILKNVITTVDHTMIPPGFHGDAQSFRAIQDMLCAIVDRLGKLSSAAQGLNRVITSAMKMRCSDSTLLYLLKDAKGNGGKGEVVGLLKVGHKHLYLSDSTGKVYEVEPLCILDFYIQQDRQRHGLGKKLFDYMLQDKNTPPHHLAVDGPSPIMLQFLAKTYGMKDMIRHANNFAVAAAFFKDINKISKSGCSTPASSSGARAGRFTAPKPMSGISQIIHGSTEVSAPSVSPMEDVGQWPALAPIADQEPPRATPSPVETEAGDAMPPVEALPPVERPCTLHVETVAPATSNATSSAGSTTSRRLSQLTDKGYFDVKFYHNKLW